MGQEIDAARFKKRDFERFLKHLKDETELLRQWYESGMFDDRHPVAGFELEAWLVDDRLRPAPVNDRFLEQMSGELVSPELAKFNVEFNVEPVGLRGKALSTLADELLAIWNRGDRVARDLDSELVMTGILPTLVDDDLVMDNLSSLHRYEALNAQVLRARDNRPLKLDIHGRDTLQVEHHDVLLESATTSFQIHLQVPPPLAVQAYNASIIASGPLLAASANSPYLFGKDLWAETRIPVFEQAVEAGGYDSVSHGPLRRVTFGSGYARKSILECFVENLEHYPVLLPVEFPDGRDELKHLRLHNGTLWRWNRPLIGFDAEGTPHIRIEQRVVPAGPTIADAVANAAYYYGLAIALCNLDPPPEEVLPFPQARDNFYAAAQFGMDAHLVWLDGQKHPARQVLRDQILPLAYEGLETLGIDVKEIDHYLGIIEARLTRGINGATWQRGFVARHGTDMTRLLKAYLERQQSGRPVYEWDLD